MRAGRLRHRVTLQAPTQTQDSTTGAIVPAWATVTGMGSVPAEVLTGPGREFRASGAAQAETTARVTLRWFEGLSPAWRILWDGRVYNIGSIETDPTGRREYRLRCTDGVNDG